MMKDRIYLDHNATTPLRPQAQDAMLQALKVPHNASSVHSFGREAKKITEDARFHVAKLVNAPVNQVIFNSGATEGNNTVLRHFSGEKILISAIEHPSVTEAAPHADKIPVTEDGIINMPALEKILSANKYSLISVMLANNETGAIQPITEISALAKRHGALVYCDAVQAAGKIDIDITKLGVDFLTLSSHKLGGPQGAGALVLGLCGITPTLLHGGGQEKKARAGTENVAAIAGFGAAAQEARENLENFQNLTKLRDKLETALKKRSPQIKIHAANTPRIANTTLLSLPGAKAETLLMAFDLDGIALSNGSACSSGRVEPSHVLKAMNVPTDTAAGTIRVSMGWNTKETDIESFLNVWDKIIQRITKK